VDQFLSVRNVASLGADRTGQFIRGPQVAPEQAQLGPHSTRPAMSETSFSVEDRPQFGQLGAELPICRSRSKIVPQVGQRYS
jgi:hypothetical protein